MWPYLTLLLGLALVATHCAWRRRFAHQARKVLAESTALREHQRAIEVQSRERQAALFNSMVEGVLVLDRNARIQLANAPFGRLLGLTDDFRGRPLLEAVRSHELAELVDRLTREATVDSLEWRAPGGQERWFEVNATALRGSDGVADGFIVVFHDLTRIKQLERTRQEFVANVSHELRTPLSLIQGFVESLLDGARNDPALNEKFLRTVERNVRRLARLLEDLLAISELESGRTRLELAPVDLPAAAAEAIEEFKARAESRRIAIANEVPPVVVAADAHRLHQVLSNLLDNALKYGRTGGQVKLGGRVTVDGLVELSVADDGPGLPPEAVSRVFERFYRVDKARSREQGGTGLGLSIVKHIVQAHGGRVWVESQPGRGATFFFTLARVA